MWRVLIRRWRRVWNVQLAKWQILLVAGCFERHVIQSPILVSPSAYTACISACVSLTCILGFKSISLCVDRTIVIVCWALVCWVSDTQVFCVGVSGCLSVWSLHVLFITVWVFFPSSKHRHVGLHGDPLLALKHNVMQRVRRLVSTVSVSEVAFHGVSSATWRRGIRVESYLGHCS